MSQNYSQPGKALTVVAPYALSAGDGCLVGSIFGFACDDALITADVVIDTEGVHEAAKTAAEAWAVGDRVFWVVATDLLSNVPTSGMFVGVATEIAANPTSTGFVKLCPGAELAEGVQAAVVVLTDNTGGSGTHDDTLADGLTSVAPAAVAAYAALANLTDPVTKAEGEALSTQAATARTERENLRSVVATLVTDVTVNNQNVSDLGQKLIEIRAVLVTAGLITA